MCRIDVWPVAESVDKPTTENRCRFGALHLKVCQYKIENYRMPCNKLFYIYIFCVYLLELAICLDIVSLKYLSKIIRCFRAPSWALCAMQHNTTKQTFSSWFRLYLTHPYQVFLVYSSTLCVCAQIIRRESHLHAWNLQWTLFVRENQKKKKI